MLPPWRTPSGASKPAEELKERLKRKRLEQQTLEQRSSASKPAEELQKRLKRKRVEQQTLEQQSSASKLAAQDGVVLAVQRYDELQERFQEVFWECNEVWQTSTSYEKEGPRKSWRAAMEHLQNILRGVFHETLSSMRSIEGLSEGERSKLGSAAALLWTKVQGRKDESVLQNQIRHLQAVTQAIADDVCWKRILDELLTNESMTQETRQQQVTHLDAQIGSTFVALKTITAEAREYALS